MRMLRIGSQATRNTHDIAFPEGEDIEAGIREGRFVLPTGEVACSAAKLEGGKITETYGWFSPPEVRF